MTAPPVVLRPEGGQKLSADPKVQTVAAHPISEGTITCCAASGDKYRNHRHRRFPAATWVAVVDFPFIGGFTV